MSTSCDRASDGVHEGVRSHTGGDVGAAEEPAQGQGNAPSFPTFPGQPTDSLPQLISWENKLLWYEEKSIAVTFVRQLRDLDQHSPAAANLLKIMAYLDTESISLELLTHGATAVSARYQQTPPANSTSVSVLKPLSASACRIMEKLHLAKPAYTRLDLIHFKMSSILDLIQSPDDLKRALMQLQNLYLIKPRQEAGHSSMWMHRLIQTVVLEYTRKSGGETDCFETAVALTCKAFEQIGDPTSPEEWPRCETLIPHIQSLIARDGVSDQATNEILLTSRGVVQYMASRERFTDALELSQPLLSRRSDHAAALISIFNQASVYVFQSLYSDAESWVQKALDVTRKWSGLRHIEIQLMHIQALTYSYLGNFEKAERSLKHVLRDLKNRLGPEHVDTLDAMRHLALTYQLQHRHSDAEPLFDQVLRARQKHHGSDHVITLSAMQDLGLVYKQQRRYNDAERLFDQVRKSVLDDTLFFTTTHHLAFVYSYQGRYSESEKLFKQVLERRQQDLGPEHVDTLSIMGTLALVHQSQRQYDDAEQLLRDVLQVRRKRFGLEDVDTLSTMDSLALLYKSRERYDDAEPLLRELLHARRNKFGPEHASTLSTLQSLKSVRECQGRSDDGVGMHGPTSESLPYPIQSPSSPPPALGTHAIPFLKTYATPVLAVAFCYILSLAFCYILSRPLRKYLFLA